MRATKARSCGAGTEVRWPQTPSGPRSGRLMFMPSSLRRRGGPPVHEGDCVSRRSRPRRTPRRGWRREVTPGLAATADQPGRRSTTQSGRPCASMKMNAPPGFSQERATASRVRSASAPSSAQASTPQRRPRPTCPPRPVASADADAPGARERPDACEPPPAMQPSSSYSHDSPLSASKPAHQPKPAASSTMTPLETTPSSQRVTCPAPSTKGRRGWDRARSGRGADTSPPSRRLEATRLRADLPRGRWLVRARPFASRIRRKPLSSALPRHSGHRSAQPSRSSSLRTS